MSRPTKRTIRYFLSYAHDDDKLSDKLLAELDKQLGACKGYIFKRWQDTHILPGEKWHEEIQKAAKECDFGLLFVSPAFLGSKYIGEHELPLFVRGEKPCVPVGLCRIDFAHHDTKGLSETQIYLHATPRGKGRKYFAECTPKQAADFAHSLFGQIMERLAKLFAEASIPLPSKSAVPVKVTNNLPRLPSFFGRQKELDTIAKALLPATRTWGVLIDGPGGMGKTSLAVRSAEIAAPQFDRVLFVSTKAQKLTPEGTVAVTNSIVPAYPEILNQIAHLIGQPHLTEKSETERASLIKASIQTEKVLLILDNLENLEKAQQNLLFEFVSDLPPGCKAIVTSRRRTDVDARIIRLEKLEQDAALEFLEELSADRPLLAKASREQRLHLYEETGGNPLLLRWVVGQLGRGSCRSIANALDLCRKASASNEPLEFIFGDLLETFTEAETKALAALTFFTQKIEVRHISELAGLSKMAAQTALGDLANRALVIPDETEENFALVPMVADFLRNKRPEVVRQTGNRLEQRAFALIVENGYQKHERFPVLDAAWPSVAPAFPRFISGPLGRLRKVWNALTHFLEFTGRWDESLALDQQAEAKALSEGDRFFAGWCVYHSGYIISLRQQADAVFVCAERLTSHWATPQAGPSERGSIFRLRGIWHQLNKDHSAAIIAYRQALDHWTNLPKVGVEVAIGLNSLAIAERDSGDMTAAEGHYREALSVFREIDNIEGVSAIMGNLATVALDQKNWPAAENMAREALRLTEKLGRQELIANHCQCLATALLCQKKADQALPNARRAVQIYSRLGSPCSANAQAILTECEAAV